MKSALEFVDTAKKTGKYLDGICYIYFFTVCLLYTSGSGLHSVRQRVDGFEVVNHQLRHPFAFGTAGIEICVNAPELSCQVAACCVGVERQMEIVIPHIGLTDGRSCAAVGVVSGEVDS